MDEDPWERRSGGSGLQHVNVNFGKRGFLCPVSSESRGSKDTAERGFPAVRICQVIGRGQMISTIGLVDRQVVEFTHQEVNTGAASRSSEGC